MKRPRVSVCICTRNRPEELWRCLDSIGRSTVPVDNLVISDDSTDERTARMVAARGRGIVYVEGPRRGLAANRNMAIAASSGDHILFLDDDACLGGQFIERALTRIADDPRLVLSGCELRHGTIIRAHDQGFLGYQDVPYGRAGRLNTIVINSTLFPRSLFDVARFDEQLIYGFDEVDIALQAVHHGYRIVHDDGAVNFHYPSIVNRDYYKPHEELSRLYVTFKRYALYERSWMKAVAFAAAAPTHHFLAALKRHGARGLRDACRTVIGAGRLSVAALRANARTSSACAPMQSRCGVDAGSTPRSQT
jgi:GT2 family glycosyltransferase